jgi:serine/threonine-protein kinase
VQSFYGGLDRGSRAEGAARAFIGDTVERTVSGQHAGNDVVGRFISEARAVAHLQHPGIVQIFDIGEHKGLPWFSLEFVDGTDLQHDLNGQPQHPRDAAEMVVKTNAN